MTVARWHSNPSPRLRKSGDTIEGHQWRVAHLCRQISPSASDELIRAALHHDEAERLIGDMPAPAKRMFPGLADAYRQAEIKAMEMLGIPPFKLTPLEWAILDIADKADAWRWAVHHGEGDNPEWVEAKRALLKAAWAIDAGAWWAGFAKEVQG